MNQFFSNHYVIKQLTQEPRKKKKKGEKIIIQFQKALEPNKPRLPREQPSWLGNTPR